MVKKIYNVYTHSLSKLMQILQKGQNKWIYKCYLIQINVVEWLDEKPFKHLASD